MSWKRWASACIRLYLWVWKHPTLYQNCSKHKQFAYVNGPKSRSLLWCFAFCPQGGVFRPLKWWEPRERNSRLLMRNTGSSAALLACSKIGALLPKSSCFIGRCWTWSFNHMSLLENHLLEKMEENKTVLENFWQNKTPDYANISLHYPFPERELCGWCQFLCRSSDWMK